MVATQKEYRTFGLRLLERIERGAKELDHLAVVVELGKSLVEYCQCQQRNLDQEYVDSEPRANFDSAKLKVEVLVNDLLKINAAVEKATGKKLERRTQDLPLSFLHESRLEKSPAPEAPVE